MASPQKQAPKPTSRWGFITQAVASVESRLDTILADEEVPSRKPTPQPTASKENAPPARASTDSTRGSTSANDRLQERLARAMAKKSLKQADSPAASETGSRATTPAAISSPNTTIDTEDTKVNSPEDGVGLGIDTSAPQQTIGLEKVPQQLLEKVNTPEILQSELNSRRPSKDSVRTSQERSTSQIPSDEADAALLQVQLEHEDVKTQMQDEIRGYIERIDALNAKLQYLAKEAAGSAKQLAIDAEHGSLEKKLLERDERIALLMEEGQNLSMTEMKHLATIKKLRAQVGTSSRDQDAVKQRAGRAEKMLSTLEERAAKAEALVKSTDAKLVEASKKAQGFEALQRERIALNDTLVEMRSQVTRANARAESAESKVRTEQFELEQRRVIELQEDLSSAKVERELTEEKLRQEIKDLRAALDMEKSQSKAMETEMLAEQATLESRLEAFRVRAEEASANDQGDSQAKLLRQVETLQSQYTEASQNWQGIESSLVTRITALEKERDELTTREGNVRRKLKEATSKAKTSEKEVENLQLEYATLQEAQTEAQVEAQRLTRKVQQLEDDLARAHKETDEQKAKMDRDFLRRLEEEKSRWAASIQLVRTESPAASIRKSSNYDTNHLPNPYVERPVSRRSSSLALAFANAESYSPSRHHSTTSSKNMYNGSMPETPILITTDPDEYFSGVPVTPISPDYAPSRRGVGDIVSTSTVGAGPSIQLVERMSANVRRLESEKAASKDELARITSQRDDSRQEVVRLMREVEQKRKFEQLLKKLEQEHKILDQRHQTTLELLGEKSEQVEELKADILDVKQMYRQLADQMK